MVKISYFASVVTLLLSLLLPTTTAFASPFAVPATSVRLHSSDSPAYVRVGETRPNSAQLAASVSQRLTTMEASGRVSAVSASKIRHQLNELIKARTTLTAKYKMVPAAEERKLTGQLTTLNKQLDSERRQSRNAAASWFNWF